MHIERILLRNVGPFHEETIEFPKGTDPAVADVYLLTGPNGTGKSTVLYALAAALSGDQELLRPRMHSAETTVTITSDGGSSSVLQVSGQTSSFSLGPFVGANARGIPPADWAAFSYAGTRSMVDVQVTSVQQPANPLTNNLSFLATGDTNQLAHWIASQNYRRLKAKDANNVQKAERIERSIQTIEKAIADITEDQRFGFVITEEDDDIRIRWRGLTVRFGALPDGLKSIISWIADLLMRLDRIPWRDNIPVLERQFLLLLDEIDIHLHPAWQRRVLPLVQRLFPNAQIIASTHSPFVVSSLADGRIISLGLEGASAKVVHEDVPQLGVSYSAVLRSIFGIESEFDLDTERKLQEFHAARRRRLGGDESAQADVDRIADELKQRSEELRGLIALELGQMRRQLALRAAP